MKRSQADNPFFFPLLIRLSLFLSIFMYSCYYPVVVAPPPPSPYELSWDYALRAANDVGIQITSADKPSGTISGQRGSTGVTIIVMQQPDGRIRVEVELQSHQPQASRVAEDFYRAYDRYMGRR